MYAIYAVKCLLLRRKTIKEDASQWKLNKYKGAINY